MTTRPTSPPAQPSSAGAALRLRRLLVAALFSLLALSLVPVAASAQSSEPGVGAYAGTWTSTTGQMTLNRDGTGYLTVSHTSGGEAWSVRWSVLPGSILVELETQAMVDRAGLGGQLTADTWWYGTLQRSAGVTVLNLADPPGTPATPGVATLWCAGSDSGSAAFCGG